MFVLLNAIPCVEWIDLQGHLESMKWVSKKVDSLVGYERNREKKQRKKNRGQNTSREDFLVFVSLFY